MHVRDQVIWDLVKTREFQRLRRIKQLGTTYLVFHGAEHSRFNHSLGVYEIVRRIVDDVFKGRPEWDESERLLLTRRISSGGAVLIQIGRMSFFLSVIR